jgi:phosphate transport system protein
VVAAIKIASDIERIGDYAKNIAKRAIVLSAHAPLKPVASIPRMSQLALHIIKDVLDAYIEKDAEGARAAWRRDEEVDEMYNSVFREMLTYMMEDPRNIGPCTHLLFIAKNIERIGDHATNVAEIVYFLVHGRSLDEERPKGDTTNVPIDA